MNQQTHAWIALRATALLEDAGENPQLVRLLSTYAKDAAVGAWLPDLKSAKLGRSDVDNHIFKMKPLPPDDPQASRFIANRQALTKRLGPARLVSQYLKQPEQLPEAWWATPYKAEAKPGQHIPNCVMGLRLTLTDLLLMGDSQLQILIPGEVEFVRKLHAEARTPGQQAALYFFMISHFVADACMPCHCDARKLASYAAGLHQKLEEHWGDTVGKYYKDTKLPQCADSPDQILKKARETGDGFDLAFKNSVPKIPQGRDAWLEMVDVCRGSFALACIMVPFKAGEPATKCKFDDVFGGAAGKQLLADVDRIAMHDAVLNTAIVWKEVWNDFVELEKRQE